MGTQKIPKLTVVLDLDHTLICAKHPHKALQLQYQDEDLHTHLVFTDDTHDPECVFIVERPGLPVFLHELSQFCDVVLFTASLKEYAMPVLRAIDPEEKCFTHTFFREDTKKNMYYPFAKDLSSLGRPLERVVIVDDEPAAYSMQPRNGICVPKFWGNPKDDVLLSSVLPLIHKLSAAEDVRFHL